MSELGLNSAKNLHYLMIVSGKLVAKN